MRIVPAMLIVLCWLDVVTTAAPREVCSEQKLNVPAGSSVSVPPFSTVMRPYEPGARVTLPDGGTVMSGPLHAKDATVGNGFMKGSIGAPLPSRTTVPSPVVSVLSNTLHTLVPAP